MAFNKAYYGFLILFLTVLSDVVPYVLAYTNVSISNDKMCSMLLKPSIHILGENDKSGLLFQESFYFNRFRSKDNLYCHFYVEASFNFGIFAVIQKMNLRHDEFGQCLDYVQFRHAKKNQLIALFNVETGKGNWGKKYCGSMSAFEAGNLLEQEQSSLKRLSVNGFMDEEDRMEVLIVISNQQHPSRANLSLEIAFTSFKKDCYRDIGAYRLCGNDTCIWKNYFQDGIVNCPFLNCIDEGGCNGEDRDKNVLFTSLGTKVTITAVSSIFISFFLFLGCIWLCRYFEFLCWGISGIRGHSNNPMEMDPMHRATPTAPPAQQTPLDKDLPPSYDTLFPERLSVYTPVRSIGVFKTY